MNAERHMQAAMFNSTVLPDHTNAVSKNVLLTLVNRCLINAILNKDSHPLHAIEKKQPRCKTAKTL